MKKGRTLYTTADIANTRENIEKYEWARRLRVETLNRAAQWLEIPDKAVLEMVPPPSVPRALYVHETGCPVHGLTIQRYGPYAWIVSSDLPWKVKCPVGGEVYPSNDFGAYLKTGMKDRSLLTGAYPDDGWGWMKPEGDGKKFWFVGYYNHWGLWVGTILVGLKDLGLAYLLTGDSRYAHKAAIMLWQIAEYYPDYRYEKQSRRGTEFDPNYRGKILYHTWENNTAAVMAETYDSVFPALREDTVLQRLVKEPAGRIQERIEERLLREMARLIMDGSHTIQGNYGSHQHILLKLAIVLDDEERAPTKSQIVEWVLDNDDLAGYTDMGIHDALHSLIFRDGLPFESPGYNIGWVENLLLIVELLERLDVKDLIDVPKFKMLIDWPLNLLCIGHLVPSLGDSGDMFASEGTAQILRRHIYEAAFRWYNDPLYAKAWKLAPQSRENQRALIRRLLDRHRELLQKPSEELGRVAEGYRKPLGVASFNFPAYGFSILQTGNEESTSAATLLYGHFFTHGHFDRLDLGLFAYGQALLPDFGYPETANPEDPRRFGFFSHTVSHNTVMVDQRRQQLGAGKLHVFDCTPRVKVVEASAEDVYPGLVNCYRRSIVLVDSTPSEAYVIDVFRAVGGTQHDWIVHGTEAEFNVFGISLSKVQEKGTLAGEDVPYGKFYDDLSMRDKPYGTIRYVPYQGSGFQFLFNAQRGRVQSGSRVVWSCLRKGAVGVHLQAFLVPSSGEELIVCDGRPQNRLGMPETVKFMLRRKKGDNLSSSFVTVFEPYKVNPHIMRVTRLKVEPSDPTVTALKIEFHGFTDYFINAENEAETYWVEPGIYFSGYIGLLRITESGKVTMAYLLNAEEIEYEDFSLSGSRVKVTEIAAVDYRGGIITLRDPVLNPDLEGKWLIVSKKNYSSGYRVDKVLNEKSFSIGDQSCIVGRTSIQGIDFENGGIKIPLVLPFTKPGMGLMGEDGEVKYRIASTKGALLQCEGVIKVEGKLHEDAFPDLNGDGKRTLYIIDLMVGDKVIIPVSTIFISR